MSRAKPLSVLEPNDRARVFLALAWYSVATHRGITRYAHDAGWVLDGGFVRSGFVSSRWGVDGVIAVLGMHEPIDRTVRTLGVPVVNIGYAAHPGVPNVCADGRAIGRMAAEHFLSRGFRSFAYYMWSHSVGDAVRLGGFTDALAERGGKPFVIGPVQEVELQAEAEGTGRDRYQIIADALRRLPKPVAVFAEYDDRAIQVIDAARMAGLRVPEQVAVLGVNNDELRCPFAPVPLSSVDNDEERVGYEAARLLHQLMGGGAAPAEPVMIPPRGVVVRQSSNILAIPHEDVARALRIIWEHYTEPIDVTRVADQVPLSYPQLHAAFVKHVGHTMADELAKRRIEHAQRLLVKGEMKLRQVAELSGFGSADRMGRVFMRKLNVSPSDYRKQFAMRGSAAEQAFDAEQAEVPAAKPALLHRATSAADDDA